MRRYKLHIASFFLVLAGSFVFPVKYWHSHEEGGCHHEMEHHTEHHDTDSFTEICNLCDFILSTPLLTELDVEISTQLHFSSYSSVIPSFIPIPYMVRLPLRGPPAEIS